MGEIYKLRLPPLVRVEKWNAGWLVTVRPCPKGVSSLRSFSAEEEAADYATELQLDYGFRVRPDSYAISMPGAA